MEIGASTAARLRFGLRPPRSLLLWGWGCSSLPRPTRPRARCTRARRHAPARTCSTRPPKTAPQLRNAGIWEAKPLLVSGASAYRKGEFLYQDFLYDDSGARGTAGSGDPRSGATFARWDGTYALPDGRRLRAERRRPGRAAGQGARRRDRLPADLQLDDRSAARRDDDRARVARRRRSPSRTAPTSPRPAQYFLTVHGRNADLLAAGSTVPLSARAAGEGRQAPRPDRGRRPSRRLGPGRGQGADGRRHRALGRRRGSVPACPATAPTETTPGGAGGLAEPPAFFNVAFRYAEPLPNIGDLASVLTDPSWWRDHAAGARARHRRHLRVPARRSTSPSSQARKRDDLAGQARRRADERADQPDPHQPFELRPGRRLRARVRGQRRLLEPAARPAAAVLGLHPGEAAAEARLRADAAAALARRQLQPVHRLQQPVADRRARTWVDRDHARRAAAPTAGTTARPAPTRSRSGPTSRAATSSTPPTRRSPATRWAATAPTSSPPSTRTCSPPASRSSGLRARASGCRRTRPCPAVPARTRTACSPRCATSRS